MLKFFSNYKYFERYWKKYFYYYFKYSWSPSQFISFSGSFKIFISILRLAETNNRTLFDLTEGGGGFGIALGRSTWITEKKERERDFFGIILQDFFFFGTCSGGACLTINYFLTLIWVRYMFIRKNVLFLKRFKFN